MYKTIENITYKHQNQPRSIEAAHRSADGFTMLGLGLCLSHSIKPIHLRQTIKRECRSK